MYFSSTAASDDLSRYPAAIQKALRYAMETDFSQLADGQYPIDGEKMYAKVFHLKAKPLADTHPELHKKYIDVQYWISGEELCGVAPSEGGAKCIEAREADDLYFCDRAPGESFLHAWKGCYAVFFPNDLHRPGVQYEGNGAEYRKVVVKVSVDLL